MALCLDGGKRPVSKHPNPLGLIVVGSGILIVIAREI
jgi:hypothetical protein